MANKKWFLHPVIATGIVINVFVLLLAVLSIKLGISLGKKAKE